MAGNVQIIRERRSSISLRITKDGQVIVKAPHLLPQFFINQFLVTKKEWIEKSLAKVFIRFPKKRQYTEGEKFLFLGLPHILTFHTGIEIIAKDGKLFFPKVLQFRIQKELEQWFIVKAKKIISDRVQTYAQRMQTKYKDIFFSDTSSKWGTCFADNTLQFNWRLIMTPLLVVDYVVVHELTHVSEKHHQESFWRRVRLFIPAYRQHRKWLTENAHLLLT